MYWLTGLAGIAMAIAPFTFGYSDNTFALWTSVALGAILVVLSALEAWQRGKAMWEYWAIGLVGLAAMAAPFALQFSTLTIALWPIALGGVVLVLSSYEVFTYQTVQ